jgi:large subunit ribosomal protein L10
MVTRADKEQMVLAYEKVFQDAAGIVLCDYRGSTVEQTDLLREKGRAKQVQCRVIRNRLAKIAVRGSDHEALTDALVGPTLMLSGAEGAGDAAKVVVQFCKDNEGLEVKALSVGEGLLDPKDLERISKLPTRDEALSMLVSALSGPTRSLHFVLKDSATRLARTLQAVADQQSNQS